MKNQRNFLTGYYINNMKSNVNGNFNSAHDSSAIATEDELSGAKNYIIIQNFQCFTFHTFCKSHKIKRLSIRKFR